MVTQLQNNSRRAAQNAGTGHTHSRARQLRLTIVSSVPSNPSQSYKGGKARLSKYNKVMTRSDGMAHLGSVMKPRHDQRFPGPPPTEGPPFRILPVGGLGEIGMNCMLVGVHDRYVLIDAGLMFPDVTDLGMQKILPDVSFLAQWRDKIEALIITHGHEDHIGAMPWVVPALDPATPIFAAGFSMQLIKRRMQEFNIWTEGRFFTFNMRQPFDAGPFQIEPFRVTHSIPDCCGLVMRSSEGTIVHTGDWKIDETPVDGETFDRPFFEQLGREGVTLFMSDSTNVLTPGRTSSEITVQKSVMEKVLSHQGKGRVIATQFASNIHRLLGMKLAAEASGRRIGFIGTSLFTYLEAAWRDGRAPFDPRTVVQPNEIEDYDPNELLIITTGSQAEPRAALSLAAREASSLLKLHPSDLILYSAKVIPGNETRVMSMMNNVARLGPRIVMGRNDNLHTSGHAYQGELTEVLQLIKPQHFLPVHGEYAFLCAHAELAQEIGVKETSVIRNGQMLGVYDKRNNKTVSTGSMSVVGEARLQQFYNDGNKGTGTADEMALEERSKLAVDGIIVASIDLMRLTSRGEVARDLSDDEQRRARLNARIRITTRGMWTDEGRLLERLHKAAEAVIAGLPYDASLVAVERFVCESMRKTARQYNQKFPEVIAVVHEMDPRAGASVQAAQQRQGYREPRSPLRSGNPDRGQRGSGGRDGRPGSSGQPGQRAAAGSLQDKILNKRPPSFRPAAWPTQPASAQRGQPRSQADQLEQAIAGGQDSIAATATAGSLGRASHGNRLIEAMPAISYDDAEANMYDDPDELALASSSVVVAPQPSPDVEAGVESSDEDESPGMPQASPARVSPNKAPPAAAAGASASGGVMAGPPRDSSDVPETERRRFLRGLKRPQLLDLCKRVGLPEGRVEDMRNLLMPYVLSSWLD